MRKIIYILFFYLNAQAATSIEKINQLTTFFENSTLQPQYDYIENLNDGRGYTAGRIGFCTGTGDLIKVVEAFCKEVPKETICTYEKRLQEIDSKTTKTKNSNSEVTGLKGFPEAWKKAALSEKFKKIQDQFTDELYFKPAMSLLQHEGLKSNLALAIFFDTIVQHGEDGEDSLIFLINKTNKRVNLQKNSESKWLETFLLNRKKSLLYPKDKSTQKVWSESVSRVEILLSILVKDKNLDLNLPIKLSDEITIK